MPLALPKACATDRCPRLVRGPGNYCTDCLLGKQAFDKVTHVFDRGSPAERGYDARWRKAKTEYLEQHPHCVDPDKRHVGVIVSATDVDHVIPHRGDERLFWDKENWQSLCHSCSSFKTASFDGGFGNARKRRS